MMKKKKQISSIIQHIKKRKWCLKLKDDINWCTWHSIDFTVTPFSCAYTVFYLRFSFLSNSTSKNNFDLRLRGQKKINWLSYSVAVRDIIRRRRWWLKSCEWRNFISIVKGTSIFASKEIMLSSSLYPNFLALPLFLNKTLYIVSDILFVGQAVAIFKVKRIFQTKIL